MNQPAVIYQNKTYTFQDLEDLKTKWLIELANIPSNSIVMIIESYNPDSIALLNALIDKKCIIVFCAEYNTEFIEISEPSYIIFKKQIIPTFLNSDKEYYFILKEQNHAGLVFFSSGTTGKSKAIVHDYELFSVKFRKTFNSYRSLLFLKFDHLGGLNTLFHILKNSGCVIIPDNYNVSTILQLVEKYKVELLPTTPSFINLMLLSGEYKKYDLNSLKLITYGTEPMLENVLIRLSKEFPNVKLQQTYGTTEFGVMRTKSLSNNSLLVKVGGEGYETKIVDNILYVRAQSSMLGYLNALNPIDEDGWINTNDKVEESNGYLRFLGRESDIINVAGLKVFPVEIENIISEMEHVEDVLVYGKPNKLIGNIVCAKIKLSKEIKDFPKQVKSFCKSKKLDKYKMPVEIYTTTDELHTERFKKPRIKSC